MGTVKRRKPRSWVRWVTLHEGRPWNCYDTKDAALMDAHDVLIVRITDMRWVVKKKGRRSKP